MRTQYSNSMQTFNVAHASTFVFDYVYAWTQKYIARNKYAIYCHSCDVTRHASDAWAPA